MFLFERVGAAFLRLASLPCLRLARFLRLRFRFGVCSGDGSNEDCKATDGPSTSTVASVSASASYADSQNRFYEGIPVVDSGDVMSTKVFQWSTQARVIVFAAGGCYVLR